MNDMNPSWLTDEMRQAADSARRQGLQTDLRTLAARIRTDAESRYAHEGVGWQSGVEWALLYIENMAGGLTEGRS
ncbi:hypothetical protein [Streptomyces sp. NBC_00826]|uniref:hypothetical protein n=1 Tax=Streptomyces sp. NBC_00826 TaxID=2975845 RepID=UPI002F907F50|nr:hypothetical protein OG832_45845 [Streptomyces sp. NBC_00826]